MCYRFNNLQGEMLFDCWLCSDLCTSSFSLLICLSSFHTNGHRGVESRLHLTTAHNAGSLEPTGGTEITLTRAEPKEKLTYSCTCYSKQKQENLTVFPLHQQHVSVRLTVVYWCFMKAVCHPHLLPEGSRQAPCEDTTRLPM